MAETFSFAREGRRYIVFYRFGAGDLGGLRLFLEQRLGIRTGTVESLGGFARVSTFEFQGRDYAAVAGDADECHVVAPDKPARVALVDAIFGAGASGDRRAHLVSVEP